MYRYFAVVWNPSDPQASSVSSLICGRLSVAGAPWVPVFAAPGVAAFHAEPGQAASGTLVLGSGAGVVFGRIFNRDLDSPQPGPNAGLDAPESLRVLASGGLRLIERYWGRYVALIHDRAHGATWVLRDPSGGLPCLFAQHRGVNLIFSDLEDCVALDLLHFSVNWRYIRALVASSGLQQRETALQEVSEIQLGERIYLEGASSPQRAFAWSPFVIARTDPVNDPEIAVGALRRTTRACVHAWAACYPRIVHNLSGGLDSSIVLSCLRDAPSQPEVTCLHYFGNGPQEDERKYARLMASHALVELVEHQLDVREVRLEGLKALRRTSRPWYYMYELEHGRFESELALQRHAAGLFSGAGGDGVFFQGRADLAVTDYLFDHGPGRGWLGVAMDAARISHRSIWPLLLGSVRSRLRPSRWDSISELAQRPRTLVNEEVVRLARRETSASYAWFTEDATRSVPPGILWHALTVAASPPYYSAFSGNGCPEQTLPLMSQPLVELCLRIPTYVLIRDGVDRATARRAFARDLPREILARRNKGRIDQHLRNLLDANRQVVREWLLDGWLVREGLLNRDILELYLRPEGSRSDHQYSEILQHYLCIEAWLAGWLEGGAPGVRRILPESLSV